MRANYIQITFGIIFLVFASVATHAATITWTGNHSNQWNHVENWNPMIVPTGTDEVIIPAVTNTEIIIDGANASCKTLSYNGTGFSLLINGGWELIISGDLNITGNTKIHGFGGITVIGNNDCHLNYSDSTIIDLNHIDIKSNASTFLTNTLYMPLGKLNVYSGELYTMGNEVVINTLAVVPGNASRGLHIDQSTITSIITNISVLNGGTFSATGSVLNSKLLVQTDGNINFNVINAEDKSTITTAQNNSQIHITELNANGSINIIGSEYYTSQSFSIVSLNILHSSSIVKLSPSPIVSGYHFFTIQTQPGCMGDVLFTDESEVRGNQVMFHILGGVNIDKASCANINVVSGSFIIGNGMDIGNNTNVTFLQSTPVTFYWINGQGNWNDVNHWSLTSGGSPSGCIPGLNDHVTFNNASGFSATDTVKITNHTFCNNLIADPGLINQPTFHSSNFTDLTLNIAGDLDLRGFNDYQVIYQLVFRNKSINHINTGSNSIKANIYFTNQGTTELNSDLNCMEGTKFIFQLLGHIKTNGYNITTCGIIHSKIKPATNTSRNV